MNFDDFDTQIQSDELEENFMEHNESMSCAPTMQKTLYYDMPTQVKFFDFYGKEPYWIGGVAYHDEIICGCCGGTFEMEDVVIEKGLPWVSLCEEICPDEDYGEIEDEEEEE